jgi:ferredoxin--NADP+ reductase
MYEILEKRMLAPGFKEITFYAPLIASKIKPGQFVVLRVDEKGERIPMSISDYDAKSLTTVVHEVGVTTKKLGRLEVGEKIMNVVGPLGVPSAVRMYGHVIGICKGGTSAALHPVLRSLKESGNKVTAILGANSSEFLVYEDKLGTVCDELIVATDDGTKGRKGSTVDALRECLASKTADFVIAIGPTKMMSTVAKITKERRIRCVASLAPIMVDGTGMCGACRVTVSGKTRFACVHGPEFEAHDIDFDELLRRQKMFKDEEKRAMERI